MENPHSEAVTRLPHNTFSRPDDEDSPLGGSDKAMTTVHPIAPMMENPHSEAITRLP